VTLVTLFALGGSSPILLYYSYTHNLSILNIKTMCFRSHDKTDIWGGSESAAHLATPVVTEGAVTVCLILYDPVFGDPHCLAFPLLLLQPYHRDLTFAN